MMYNWNTLNSKVLRKMGYDPGEFVTKQNCALDHRSHDDRYRPRRPRRLRHHHWFTFAFLMRSDWSRREQVQPL